MRRILIIVAIVLLPAIPIVLLVSGVIKQKPKRVSPVQLLIWSTEDTDKAFAETIAAYNVNHPYVKVTYQKVRPEDYQQQLVSGWARGQGPDIFFVPHDWVGGMRQFATPMPASLAVPEVRSNKSILGPATEIVTPVQPAPTLTQLQNTFIDVVISDVNLDGQVWGLPLSLDTIVVYYNKDLLNNAKIFEPARTWGELVGQAGQLTVTDERGGLVQSAVAIGTANNVPYAADLLTLLMMQNGATMVNIKKEARFREAPGLNALNFYTSFAQSKKATYSWTADKPNARDAFLQGKVAYYFGTLADRTGIAASNLNWGVSPMLHLNVQGDNDPSGNVRFMDAARYSIGMVSKAAQIGKRELPAWNLLYFMSSANRVTAYLQETGRLAAHKKLLAAQADHEVVGVFANQLLTARSWYHGNDGPAVAGYLEALISSVVSGKVDPQRALDLAADQVESTL